MSCNQEDLLRFVRAELDVDEMERVLEHLEHCRDCSDSLQVMVRLRANRGELREVLAANAIPGIGSGSPWRWYAAAAAALIVLTSSLLFILIRSGRTPVDLAGLAVEERYPYRPMILRGDTPAPAEQFAEAINAYEQNVLPRARRLLDGYITQNPEDADAYFYLGVCRYLLGDLPEARNALEIGLGLRTIQPEEKYHWYLAQVYLKLRQADRARRELLTVISFNGEFATRAESILMRMR
jgi:tetratricopeptide (TPR) repeat protein